MKDFIIALVSFLIIGKLMSSSESQTPSILQENWGTNPSMSVSVETVGITEKKPSTSNTRSGASAAMSLSSNTGQYSGDIYTIPPNLQNSLQLYDRGAAANLNLPATISYSLPAQSMLPATSTTNRGAAMALNSMGGMSSTSNDGKCCTPSSQHAQAAAAMKVGSFEKYEDYEPISLGASRAQALADDGYVKKANAPSITLETPEDGMVEVSVIDRMVYSNSKSRLRGAGDPIRGDIGCIVPIKDQWFRPSARPNIDLRQGAIAILAGIENETPRELKALQNAYSAGTSTKDSYSYQTSPAQTQKAIGLSGNEGAYENVEVAAYF